MTLSFVPDSENYQGPTPQAASFAVHGTNAFSSPLEIILKGTSGITRTITITGNSYNISSINKQ
jgi:hypothetical protein